MRTVGGCVRTVAGRVPALRPVERGRVGLAGSGRVTSWTLRAWEVADLTET